MSEHTAEIDAGVREDGLCYEFIETGDCDHTDAEHDAMQTCPIPPGSGPSC